MAVGCWSYANIKTKTAQEDYFVRVCDPMFESFRDQMLLLSNRMLAVDQRFGMARNQHCWFAGYLEENIYVVALAGEQEELLGVPLYDSGIRPQFCVLAYGFTGEDIHRYAKETALFEPLKEFLRNKNRLMGNQEAVMLLSEQMRDFAFSDFWEQEKEGEAVSLEEANLFPSNPKTEETLWQESFSQPVLLGVFSLLDAERLLKIFPQARMTVRGLKEAKSQTSRNCQDVTAQIKRYQEQKKREEEQEQRQKEEREKALRQLEEERRRQEALQRQAELRKKQLLLCLAIGIVLILLLLFSMEVWEPFFNEIQSG
ncbi:MAG: hypothetical protein Q4D90_02935 [bacterium]|nr:hypothetical protein [bacterium]